VYLAEATVNQAVVEATRQKPQLQARSYYIAQHGERGGCGFTWVDIYGIRANSKLGKALIANGFRKDSYNKSLKFWSPDKTTTQSVAAKEAGAQAFVTVMKNSFEDIRIYADSRLD
jgi:hypothetical protein